LFTEINVHRERLNRQHQYPLGQALWVPALPQEVARRAMEARYERRRYQMGSTRSGWQHSAACRDEDSELFFPVSDMGPGAEQVKQAKAVCAQCPVRSACLEYALDNGLDYGIFGGATERERRDLARRSHRRASAA
jgi:WhiB family redox-sensing transcriptional regulator